MELETERLLLREFSAEDWRALYAYQNDPRYLELYEWEHRTEPDVKAFLQRFIDSQQANPRAWYQLAIVVRATKRVIGNVGIRRRHATSPHADLGYELAPGEWNNGYATEAAGAMLQLAFENLRLHRVTAYCLAENHRSQRVLEKLGLRREGCLRENEYFKSRYWDTLIYGILDEEWRWRLASL